MQPEPKELYICYTLDEKYYIKLIAGWYTHDGEVYPVILIDNILRVIYLGVDAPVTNVRIVTRNDIHKYVEVLLIANNEIEIISDLDFYRS